MKNPMGSLPGMQEAAEEAGDDAEDDVLRSFESPREGRCIYPSAQVGSHAGRMRTLPPGAGDHHELDLGRRRQPRAVPRDPLHARGVRRRGAAGGRGGRRDDPHPRAHARRRALLRDRGLPGDHGGDPRRGARRDRQLLDRRDRRAAREADRLPARARARHRRAQHGLDELREVLAPARGLRVQDRLRELVRHDHRALHRDARGGHQARARVLRLGAPRQPRPAAATWACSSRRCRSRA